MTAVYVQSENIDPQILISVFGKPPPTTPKYTETTTKKEETTSTNTPTTTDNMIDKATGEMIQPLPSRCDGKCVNYYLCENNTINTDGLGIIDIRYVLSAIIIILFPCLNVVYLMLVKQHVKHCTILLAHSKQLIYTCDIQILVGKY